MKNITKNDLRELLLDHMESAMAYHAISNERMFNFYSGKCYALMMLLEDFFSWSIGEEDEHMNNMYDILEEN